MPESELTKLRRVRIRAHKSIKQTEAVLAWHKERLARAEARINEIAPELKLQAQYRKPNGVFARGELTRMVLEVLRDADGPMPSRLIALEMLARKGYPMPDPTMRKRLQKRLSMALSVFHARGMVVLEGRQRSWTWRLAK